MAHFSWRVSLNGVQFADGYLQTVQINVGQKSYTDPVTTGTCTISGWDIDQLPTIEIGDLLRIVAVDEDDTASPKYQRAFTFNVTDVQLSYGITPDLDRWVITGADAVALLGRSSIDVTWAAGTVDDAMTALQSAAGLVNATYNATTAVSAQTLTNSNGLQVFQQLVNTEQGYITTSHNSVGVYKRGSEIQTPDAYASDDGTFGGVSVTAFKYDQIEFANLIGQYTEKVEATADGLATQTVGTGTISYSYDTYNASTSDALSNAEYVAASLEANAVSPISLSCLDRASSGYSMMQFAAVRRCIGVRLRTVDYLVNVIGVSITANAVSTRIQMYLRGSISQQFLVLDNPTRGKLDENKLGW